MVLMADAKKESESKETEETSTDDIEDNAEPLDVEEVDKPT